jgi:adenylate kinase
LGRVVIVTGIPGTGKSTVCNELLNLAEKVERKVVVINYGTVMVELSKKRGESFHRDDLRKTNLSFQLGLQKKAAETISQKAVNTEGIVIVDTHMSIKTADGYLPGLPFPVLQLLKPTAFVLVEAEPQEVLSRRFKDTTRKRDKALESEIMDEFRFSRFMAAACSVLTGASVKIVKNPSGEQVKAAKEIMKLLNGEM